ncbi:hypothetical protein DBV05_g10815 [Lasiodiplodia theobromae]|uniref:AB hydrolase-1 domain-containing protein n=1 Tax=Lasiodiplodia theobromae TaxID=45133 RepID=A0A5N5CZ11_9PEZI|nr:hypothetical protein DBV05_g10815 [Lasiodiplodia theobromae]
MLPTIVGCPGAWHTADFFDDLARSFRARGYNFVSQDAPGVLDLANGFDATADKDADSLRANLLVPLVESGQDVALLMHSYGGVYGAAAVRGLSKGERQRAAGHQAVGGVVGLIFVSAVTPVAGKSTLDMMGTDKEHLPPWVDYDDTTGFVAFSGARDVMYHDLAEPIAARFLSMVRPQALNSLNSPVSYSPLADPFFANKSAYVLCGADRVIPLAGQEAYAAVGGIERTVLVPQATHAFFATAQEEVVDATVKLLEDIRAANE